VENQKKRMIAGATAAIKQIESGKLDKETIGEWWEEANEQRKRSSANGLGPSRS
jgi:hypothetical protein